MTIIAQWHALFEMEADSVLHELQLISLWHLDWAMHVESALLLVQFGVLFISIFLLPSGVWCFVKMICRQHTFTQTSIHCAVLFSLHHVRRNYIIGMCTALAVFWCRHDNDCLFFSLLLFAVVVHLHCYGYERMTDHINAILLRDIFVVLMLQCCFHLHAHTHALSQNVHTSIFSHRSNDERLLGWHYSIARQKRAASFYPPSPFSPLLSIPLTRKRTNLWWIKSLSIRLAADLYTKKNHQHLAYFHSSILVLPNLICEYFIVVKLLLLLLLLLTTFNFAASKRTTLIFCTTWKWQAAKQPTKKFILNCWNKSFHNLHIRLLCAILQNLSINNFSFQHNKSLCRDMQNELIGMVCGWWKRTPCTAKSNE